MKMIKIYPTLEQILKMFSTRRMVLYFQGKQEKKKRMFLKPIQTIDSQVMFGYRKVLRKEKKCKRK